MMKRFVVASVLLVSAFACSGSPETSTAPVTAAHELNQDAIDAADDLVHTVPTGTFASPTAFCDAQKKLIGPKLAEASTSLKADGTIEKDLAPACKEDRAALAKTSIALAAPYLETTAVTFESGFSEETYLLARTTEGWSAVRSAVLYTNHNDPGCPSIEYTMAISQIHVEHGALVITTASERGWYLNEDTGELYLTYVRACRPAPNGVACGTPEVANAKLVLQDLVNAEAPIRTRFFSTGYSVGGGVTIEPAQRFDEATL